MNEPLLQAKNVEIMFGGLKPSPTLFGTLSS
jgi:hypothetical protein